ncbi:MAG: ABC transporter ATP-binding protein [Defluviitaleaceae bacterium]|nr:ABC transporter ATP-binding protein [Defluviitaleaceae bacterium]
MIRVSKLNCGYEDQHVLFDLTFSVKSNQFLMILGPNGCGKTTLLKALAGLLPYQGQITFNNTDIQTLKKQALSKKIAFLSQKSAIYFDYTVYETVMQGRYVHFKKTFFKEAAAEDHEVVQTYLQMTDLLDLKDKSIKELSGGQLQRVFLARVLVQEPQLILLDEPTNHLDLRHQLELMTYLDEWVKQPDRLVIGVVHDLNLALTFADELLLLKSGQIVAHESCETIDLNVMNDVFETQVVAYMKAALTRWKR